ncbi:transposase domain-containing protein [Streptomyces sp. NPDC001093]|uniref:transposase domain-containing protein n=1 Tax=Streptomyces sp. NPDC001093 TaxID=3154376 RepID=UPI00331D0552
MLVELFARITLCELIRVVSGGTLLCGAPGVVRVSTDVGELSGLGLLTRVYPPGLVDRVVAACGRAERRRRLLPARLVVYFVLGLALFSPAPYLEVMRHLVEGLRGQGLLGGWHVPAKSSLFRARQRLGREPFLSCAVRRDGQADGHRGGSRRFLARVAAAGGGRDPLGRRGH